MLSMPNDCAADLCICIHGAMSAHFLGHWQDADAKASVFGRWQRQWAAPLMLLFTSGSAPHTKGLHYFLVDVCLALLRWSQLDASQLPAEAAALLMSHLVRNSSMSRRIAACHTSMEVRVPTSIANAGRGL